MTIQDVTLTNKTQRVVIDGEESDKGWIKSDVPQGSVLGPLLFLIYVNAISEGLNGGTVLRLFADDSLLYRNIRKIKDAYKLQDDINKLQSWEAKNKMEFHPRKCQVTYITNKREPIINQYTIHDIELEKTDGAKYLGVIIDKGIKWKKHIKHGTSKANRTLAFLPRNISQCNSETKKPIQEYSCSVWNPHIKRDIENMKAQRRAARFIITTISPRWTSSFRSLLFLTPISWFFGVNLPLDPKLLFFDRLIFSPHWPSTS